jgi:hypothetical protein
LFFEFISNFGVNRIQLFAMSAPWSIELNEDVVELLKDLREIAVVENQNISFLIVGSKSCNQENKD